LYSNGSSGYSSTNPETVTGILVQLLSANCGGVFVNGENLPALKSGSSAAFLLVKETKVESSYWEGGIVGRIYEDFITLWKGSVFDCLKIAEV